VLKVTTPECFTAARLTVAVRSSTGANLDFPGAVNGVELCPSGYTLTTSVRAFTAGTYTLYGSWKDDAGAWHALPSVQLTVGAAAPSPSPTPTPTPTPTSGGTGPSWDASGAWTSKFSDEFSASALDTSKWTPGWFGTGITGPVNSAETVRYSSANVSVSGGVLHLKIQNGYGAHINSDGKYSFSRGAVEYRAFLPASGGQVANWPALWDNGQSWPADGENDTAEGLSGQVCTYWHASGTDAGSCHGGTYAGAWHTYGYEWTPTKVTWYYDGAKVREQATTVSSPHYLILQNTQGEYGGPNASADLQVDYVRVWQR
jgi:beta-glucanase (GH16 family)